eukprot:2264040-Alexandrium_andersonii.AAC.1
MCIRDRSSSQQSTPSEVAVPLALESQDATMEEGEQPPTHTESALVTSVPVTPTATTGAAGSEAKAPPAAQQAA